MGWLAATPAGDKASRLDQYQEAGRTPPYVEIEQGEYLFSAVMELGPVVNNGMGLMAQPWSEITAYCGNDFERWEIRAISQMCKAYLRGLKLGESAMSIMPMEQKGAFDV